MKVLVTGGAGFIGGHMVDKLVELGHKVTIVDNEAANQHETFRWNEKANKHVVDICDVVTMREIFEKYKFDCVFHMAAETKIQETLENPDKTFAVNVGGTLKVLELARQTNVKKVILSSTSSIYGQQEPPLNEDLDPDCLNPYALSKLEAENLCKLYTRVHGLDTVMFRYFNVYGERMPDKGQYAPVIAIFNKQKKSEKPLTIVGTGKQSRDLVHVYDVVSANIAAAISENKEICGQVFNVGTGKNYSVLQIADMIDPEGEREFLPERENEAETTKADISKIEKFLGWKPEIDLKEWITKANS